MSDLENSDLPTKDLPSIEPASYPYIGIGALVVLGIVFIFYQFTSASGYLDTLKESVSGPETMIETMKQFLGKLWLGSTMEHGAIKVDNDTKEGLLDKIVEHVEGLDI